jgi:hypothetical protein
MNILVQRRSYRQLVWLGIITLIGGIVGWTPAAAVQPSRAAPALSVVAGAPPAADGTARTVPCRSNVYPVLANTTLFDDYSWYPYSWYRPVTMASIGLEPDADPATIPGLNTTTPNSPRFRISMYGWGEWGLWHTTATGAYGYEYEDMLPMFSRAGNLSDGFAEYPNPTIESPWPQPPPPYPSVNGVLEPGDWLGPNYAATRASTPIVALKEALDEHIAQKTRMILPVYNLISGHDLAEVFYMRIERFVEVRLLAQTIYFDPSFQGIVGYLEFALLDTNKVCSATDFLYMPAMARGTIR